MPNQINSNTDIFKLNQADIFGDGKNDQSSANAGAIITASAAEGQPQTTAAIDGNLSDIDTFQKALTHDPTEHTGGNAVRRHSLLYLLRWAKKLLQGIGSELVSLPGEVGSSVDLALKATPQPISATSLPLPAGAATESTLATVRDRTRISSVFTGSVQTSAVGADFVALPSNPATSVVLYNRSGTEISWRYGSSGQELRIANSIGEEIPVVANSNTIQIRRTDQSNTQVIINFRGVLQ